jgi:carbon-monoxide dehydrogenase iron sulfur subunit
MAGEKVILQEGSFPSQCSGCRMCELVCSFVHSKVFNPSLSRIRIAKIESELIDYPVTCRQCYNPPCQKACPTQAIDRDNPLGVNQINEDLCIGCGECVLACPFGAISIPPGEKFPVSCDLCGGEPQCVQYCPMKVLTFQRDEDVARKKRERIAETESKEKNV